MKKYVNDCEVWLHSVGFLSADQRKKILAGLQNGLVDRDIQVEHTESQVIIYLFGKPPLILTSKEQEEYLIHCLKDGYSIGFFCEEEGLYDGYRRNIENPKA